MALKVKIPCPRCNGKGWIPRYYYNRKGICFRCWGAKYIYVKIPDGKTPEEVFQEMRKRELADMESKPPKQPIPDNFRNNDHPDMEEERKAYYKAQGAKSETPKQENKPKNSRDTFTVTDLNGQEKTYQRGEEVAAMTKSHSGVAYSKGKIVGISHSKKTAKVQFANGSTAEVSFNEVFPPEKADDFEERRKANEEANKKRLAQEQAERIASLKNKSLSDEEKAKIDEMPLQALQRRKELNDELLQRAIARRDQWAKEGNALLTAQYEGEIKERQERAAYIDQAIAKKQKEQEQAQKPQTAQEPGLSQEIKDQLNAMTPEELNAQRQHTEKQLEHINKTLDVLKIPSLRQKFLQQKKMGEDILAHIDSLQGKKKPNRNSFTITKPDGSKETVQKGDSVLAEHRLHDLSAIVHGKVVGISNYKGTVKLDTGSRAPIEIPMSRVQRKVNPGELEAAQKKSEALSQEFRDLIKQTGAQTADDLGNGIRVFVNGKHLGTVNVVTNDNNLHQHEQFHANIAEVNNRLKEHLKTKTKTAEGLTGDTETVRAGTGKDSIRVKTQFKVVEANDLITSHQDNGQINEAFPQELQPRDRSRSTSEAQIEQMSNELDPELLESSRKASDGAPIVGKDGIVESGNGRTMAIRRAYLKNNQSAKDYKQYLIDHAEDFGLDPEAIKQMKNPVLVRERLDDLNPEQRKEFVKKANESNVAAMSAGEQAKTDADRLDATTLSLYKGGDYRSEQNADFLQSFYAKVVPQSEAGRFWTEKMVHGSKVLMLSDEGENRIRNALFAKAYEDTGLINKLAESRDESNVKTALEALVETSPLYAQMKEDIKNGELFNLDISKEITTALRKADELRKKGQKVDVYLAQLSLFDDELSQDEKLLLRFFDANKRNKSNIEEFIKKYVEEVRGFGHPDQGSLFGAVEPPNKSDVLRAAMRQVPTGEEVIKASENDKPSKIETPQPEQQPAPEKTATPKQEPKKQPQKVGIFTVHEDTHTKTGEKLFVAKVSLPKDKFKAVSEQVDKLGGYYSRFKKGFIFKQNPTEALKGITLPGEETPSQRAQKTLERVQQALGASNAQKADRNSFGFAMEPNPKTHQYEPTQTAKRGDYVEFKHVSGKNMVGQVTGISHAKKQVTLKVNDDLEAIASFGDIKRVVPKDEINATPTEDRNTIIIPRVGNGPFVVRRGDTVAVLLHQSANRWTSGKVTGISLAKRQIKVGNVWYDANFAYPLEYAVSKGYKPPTRAEELRQQAQKMLAEAQDLRNRNEAATAGIQPGQPIQKGRDYTKDFARREARRQELLKKANELLQKADRSEKAQAQKAERASMTKEELELAKTEKDLASKKEALARAKSGESPALAALLPYLEKEVKRLERKLARLKSKKAS